MRGFSEGKSEASKQATNFGLAKTSNFFYTVLGNVFTIQFLSQIYILFVKIIKTEKFNITVNILIGGQIHFKFKFTR